MKAPAAAVDAKGTEAQTAPNGTRWGRPRSAASRPLGRTQATLAKLVTGGLLLAGWEAAARHWPLFVAHPKDVIVRIWDWSRDGTLTDNLWPTVQEVVLGFSLAVVAGILIGWILARSRLIDAGTRPFIDILNALPRVGLAPLFVLWFGLGLQAKVVLIFSVVVFIVMINVQSGIRSVEREYVLLARSLGASELDVARKVVMPSVMPWLFAALRLGGAYAIAAAVVGEFVAADRGIGYLLAFQSAVFDNVGTMAALVVLAAIAWIVTFAVAVVERRALAWRGAGAHGERSLGGI